MKVISLLLLIFNSIVLSAQVVVEVIYVPPCDYVPVEFQDDIEPVWSHLVIDSTMIEYRDSNARYQPYYKDGMEQFEFDGGSFMKDGSLFSITQVDYDKDLSGYYIEKIDIETGEKKWTIRTDLRFAEYREKALQFEIIDNEFRIYGVRCIVPDSMLYIGIFDLTGTIDAYFYQRRYDLETGELLSYNTINDEDEYAHILHFRTNKNYIIKREEDLFDILTINYSDRGGFIERDRISDFGLAVTPKDTVISGFYNNMDLSQAKFSSSRKFLQMENGDLIHLDIVFFGENFDAAPPQCRLFKYDQDYNLIKQFDINSLELPSYGSISLIRITDDNKILLRGCQNQNLRLPCRYFYLVFDTELNHLNTIRPFIQEHYFSFSYDTEIIQPDNSLIAIDRIQIFDGYSKFVAYKLKQDNDYDTLGTFTFKEKNWDGWINRAFQLDNGDLLVKINSGCLIKENYLGSWNPIWMRIKAEDLEPLTSTEDMTLSSAQVNVYPNPVSDVLNIEFDEMQNGQITIHNQLGELVSSKKLENSIQVQWDIFDLIPGIYSITISNMVGTMKTVKFVKI